MFKLNERVKDQAISLRPVKNSAPQQKSMVFNLKTPTANFSLWPSMPVYIE